MKKIFLFSICVLIISCDFTHKKKIYDNFYLIAIDVDEQMSLSYRLEDGNYIGIVEETVFALGYNDRYIIVKQHPRSFPNPPNKQITNYYIVPTYEENISFLEENVMGPLSIEKFEIKKKELGIESINFTITYQNLE